MRRFIVALGQRAVYVAFMGTKSKRDAVTDINLLQESIWPELQEKYCCSEDEQPKVRCCY